MTPENKDKLIIMLSLITIASLLAVLSVVYHENKTQEELALNETIKNATSQGYNLATYQCLLANTNFLFSNGQLVYMVNSTSINQVTINQVCGK